LERIVTDLDRKCILIAENDVLIRNLISTILSNEGYLVLAAANNMEALELSRTFTGDIGLLISKSSELAGLITAERPGVPVVLLSPSTCSVLKEVVRSIDPGAFLEQAVLPKKLTDSIQRALTDPNFGSTFVEV
jgi:DNA-binding response OmpR family regulator